MDTVTELATRGFEEKKICVKKKVVEPLFPGLELESIVKRWNMKEYILYENAIENTYK